MTQEETHKIGELRRLGITIAVVLALVGWLFFWNDLSGGFVFSLSAVILLAVAMIKPSLLRKVYNVWQFLVKVLEIVMPRVILTILFYLVFTPIGFAARILGKDFLSIRTNHKSAGYRNQSPDSYWVARKNDSLDTCRMEKQY